MGMDVYGASPTTEKGQYFRRNVWGWRPLADLVCELAPLETSGCTYWHSNDGDGLDANAAKALAKRLQTLVDNGTVAKYIADRDVCLASLPDQPCRYCDGAGIRSDAVGVENGFDKRLIGPATNADITHPRFGQVGWCNACDGAGHVRPSATFYHLNIEDVAEFIGFLHACGGFEIC